MEEKTMTVREFMKRFYVESRLDQIIPGAARKENYVKRPRAVCKDGFSISIQASCFHCCTPRISGGDIDYENVELGFPSEPDELIFNHAEDADHTNTVYPYVPIDVVEELMKKHGGIISASEKSLQIFETHACEHDEISWLVK